MRWHLLQEMSQILTESYFHRACLGVLLMSGQGPAQAVRMILSQPVTVRSALLTLFLELDDSNTRNVPYYVIDSNCIKNLALRWTRFLEVKQFKRGPEFSRFVQTLSDDNCIEKLRLKPNKHLSVDYCIAIVEACPDLSTLICPPDLLVSSLERVTEPTLSKLHTIKTTESGYANWSLFFEQLTKHNKQCPVLETLKMTLDKNGLEAISKLNGNLIPTIKSYNIMMEPDYCAPIDFPLIASAFPMFPNLETASVTSDVRCGHRDLKELPKVYKLFEKFNSKVHFTFNYIFNHEYEYSKTQVNKLETQLRTLGTVTSISRDGYYMKYSVTTSYPNKTLKLTLTIQVDDDDEAEDSEFEDDDAEDSEVEDNEEEGSEGDSEIEESDGEPANKCMKLD